jgi:hypothetical protein
MGAALPPHQAQHGQHLQQSLGGTWGSPLWHARRPVLALCPAI